MPISYPLSAKKIYKPAKSPFFLVPLVALLSQFPCYLEHLRKTAKQTTDTAKAARQWYIKNNVCFITVNETAIPIFNASAGQWPSLSFPWPPSKSEF